MVLQINDNFFRRINELKTKQSDLTTILRISVEGGGCKGFMYKYEFVKEIEYDDYIIEKQGVKVIIDPSSLNLIKGCEVDYIEELGNAYFNIKNPNASSSCSCNNSFTI